MHADLSKQPYRYENNLRQEQATHEVRTDPLPYERLAALMRSFLRTFY